MGGKLWAILFILCVACLFAAGCTEREESSHEERYCGGTVIESNLQACCDGTVYNYRNQSCCNGKIYEGTGFKECGDECYNPLTKSCCNGIITDKSLLRICGDECYNPLTHGCCNGEIYDTDTQSCNCSQQVIEEPNRICCGLTMCPQGWECCNDYRESLTCYNPKTHECVPYYDS